MNYEEFKIELRKFPLIFGQYLKLLPKDNRLIKNQLTRWQKSNKIIKLRENIYILNEHDRKINPSRLYISSELYKPSYISMEYVLSFYGLIPERVVDITCITSKKTAVIKNNLGLFSYKHIKLNYYTGFFEQKDEAGLTYYIAVPEKSIVDFIYFNQKYFKKDYRQVLFESFRFQNIDILDKKKVFEYAELFNSLKVKKIVQSLFDEVKND